MRNAWRAAPLAFALIGCQPAAPVGPDGLSVDVGRVAYLEPLGPGREVAVYDDGSRAVIVNYRLTNRSTEIVAAADLPAVLLFDPDGGAWSPDMAFATGPAGEPFYGPLADVAPGEALPVGAIFSIPGAAWSRPGWTAGRADSAPVDRSPVPTGG